jgi:hypothetical protein
MATAQTKFTTVDSLVRELLIEEHKNSTHEYLRYLTIANRGLKTLTFDVLGNTKATLLTVGSNLRVDLPEDYVDYTFVGIIASDGRLHTMGNRDNIPTAGSTTTVQARPDDFYYYYGGVFGFGGGQNRNGYYKPDIDYENWQMLFTSMEIGKVIYLEYITNGQREGGHNIIHPYCEEALIAYVYWKSIQKRRGVPMIDKEAARREWFNEKRLARARMSSFTKEEALQQIRKGFKQSPKA